jgi:hypothetical protein
MLQTGVSLTPVRDARVIGLRLRSTDSWVYIKVSSSLEVLGDVDANRKPGQKQW